jgi:hypothetical protein
LPPGIVAVIDGHIDAEGGEDLDGRGEDNGSGNPLDPDSNDGDPVGLGTQGGSEGSSGCSMQPLKSGGSTGLWLTLFGLAWLKVRRRARR